MNIIEPPAEGVETSAQPFLTVRCLKCPVTYPVTVTMDDWGRIVDDPLDFTDFWAHHWTHEVAA